MTSAQIKLLFTDIWKIRKMKPEITAAKTKFHQILYWWGDKMFYYARNEGIHLRGKVQQQ